MIRFLFAGLLFAAGFACPAQDYPSKPVRFVVNFPPGGGVDLIGRLVGNALSARIGQPVVVENRPGAGGAVGAGVVAKSAADGYTVLVTSNGAITQIPVFQPQPYDPFRDLAPLMKGVTLPTAVLVGANSPHKTLKDVLAFAKANPGKVSYGTPGNGSSFHLELELLKEKLGLDITHVPYKGAAPIMADAMSGSLTVGAPGLPPTIGNIRGGKLRLLAVWSTNRAGIFPDVPTVREVTGVPELEGLPTWYGFLLPAGVPANVAQRLETQILAAMKDADVVKKMVDAGSEVVATPSKAFGEENRKESATFGALLKRLNVKPE